MNKAAKGKNMIWNKIKTFLGDKLNLNKQGQTHQSGIYSAMLAANKDWKNRLDRDNASFRKTDNAMTMLYYLIFSTLVFQLSNYFLIDYLNQYYIFMIDWSALLIFSITLQFIMKFLRKLPARTALMQTAQIIIITLFSMLLAFFVDVIMNEFSIQKPWKYIVIAFKSLSLFIITTLIFSTIDKVHSKMIEAAEERLWHVAVNKNVSRASDQLVKSVNFTLDNMVKEISKISGIEYKKVFEIIMEISDDSKTFEEQIMAIKKVSKSDMILIRWIQYYRQALAAYLLSYMNYDSYGEISLADIG